MTQNEKGTRTGHLQGRTTMCAAQLNQPAHAYPFGKLLYTCEFPHLPPSIDD